MPTQLRSATAQRRISRLCTVSTHETFTSLFGALLVRTTKCWQMSSTRTQTRRRFDLLLRQLPENTWCSLLLVAVLQSEQQFNTLLHTHLVHPTRLTTHSS